jgi:tRNA (cytidine32/guanosine34-2'-O)-methyltransferase
MSLASTAAPPHPPPSVPPPASIDWSGLAAHVSPPPVNWQLVHGNRDVYYRRAKESGYRARSAYKLLQVQEQHRIFSSSTQRVVDLCAAPGSWSQVAAEQLQQLALSSASSPPSSSSSARPRVVAVDLQEMSPIPGVQLLQGDVTSAATMAAVLAAFSPELVDLVLCDGAPDVTGLHVMDEMMQGQLLDAVLRITVRLLRPGGILVAKIFKDEAYDLLQSDSSSRRDEHSCSATTASQLTPLPLSLCWRYAALS